MVKQADIDALRDEPLEPRQLLIDGKFRVAEDGATMTVTSPIDGADLTTIAKAGQRDVDAAVFAARRSFDAGAWSGAAPKERKKVLLRLADLIEKNALELAVLGVRDNGTEFKMAIRAEPGSAAATFRYYAEAIDKVYGEVAPTGAEHLGLMLREPVGVVGAIVPWNFPLMIGAWKLAPALAVGNSVILKPAESASLSLLRLGELALEAGLPEGVLNIVTGRGSETGEALCLNMDVDVLAFTGSGTVGRRLLEYSARSNLKRVFLELGGKSPNIVFADTPDIEAAVAGSINGMFRNSGQVCVAGSRLLVQKQIADEFTEKLIAAARALVVGDPLDLHSDVGAVSNAEQLATNLKYIDIARSEGATLATGGKRILEDSGGYYLEPTVFTGVQTDMRIAQEEIFGPVLCVMEFEDVEDAIQIANSTPYGLAAGVWTSNLGKAHQMVRAIKTGVVHVNCYGGADISLPLGGVKQSGNGHDRSLHAMDKFTDLKTAWFSI
jgi:gamma-glutamyl-gamma-aminobutyraldehyde dehydrogenase